MTKRSILRVDGDSIVVAQEQPFQSERFLQDAIAAHPSVLPSHDLGLGRLATVACELSTSAGFIDLVAADQYGRLAIVEFKKGSENPDSRAVVAQLLDYGSSLWGMSYEALESGAAHGTPGFDGTLAEHVSRSLDDPLGFDDRAFRSAIEASLSAGSFVFFYVARDLEQRATRIMRYVTESARMLFAGVEVDHFRSGDQSVLVPRLAFSPTWATGEPDSRPDELTVQLERAPVEAREFKSKMDDYAARRSVRVREARKSYVYSGKSGAKAWFYPDQGRIEFDLQSVLDRGDTACVEGVLDAIAELRGTKVTAKVYPSIACESMLGSWETAESRILDPVFVAG